MDLEPIADEVDQFGRKFLMVNTEMFARRDEGALERQPQFIFEDDADNAMCGATQCEGIARTRRPFTDRKESDKRLNFVCKRNDDAIGRRGTVVAGPEWLIMLGDRVSDTLVFVVMQRIAPPHDPL